jgi:hypothetical protein
MSRSENPVYGCGCLILVLVIISSLVLISIDGCAEKKTLCTEISCTEGSDCSLGTTQPLKVRECHTYIPYGLANKEEENPKIHYEINTGTVIWSVLLSETIVVPVLLLGWYLYEPVDVRTTQRIPGVAD